MAGYVSPIASGTASVDFSRLSVEEIKRISVKKIHVTPTFDTLLNPVPGGLYDPALGAVLDVNCTTCRMSSVHCTGHCGHIELPVACYHPLYIDTTLRLLRAKCIYCHKLRLPRILIHRTICKLRLLQHGLLEEAQRVASMHSSGKRKKTAGASTADVMENGMVESDEEEDVDSLMDRREKFVSKSIKRAKKRVLEDRLALVRNPAAISERKMIIADFLRDIALFKKCSSCLGITPSYRKDRSTKIFKKPLGPKLNELMRKAGMKTQNPLIYLKEEENVKKSAVKPLTNGWHKEDVDMTNDGSSDTPESHGAEEEIAMQNAVETSAEADSAGMKDESEHQQYMTPAEVHAALTLLFDREQEIFKLIFAPASALKNIPLSADAFFLHAILVPPNRFRPASRQGGDILEAQQNAALGSIINAVNEIEQITREMKRSEPSLSGRVRGHNDQINAAILLQEAVNCLIDNTPNPSSKQNDQGIKQVLEKKEGLFRMNMMGKRVNFAARSVISPDPNIETNEIGVPLVFAKKLTYPEPVTNHNFEQLRKAVANGMDEYPGAAAIEDENGRVLNLKFKTRDQRIALAKQLLTPTAPGMKGDCNKKVYRHLQTGDVVIMNRQPTLHKPSMMGHRARVLQNEKTIRMHYANCNTYNADFDGDEMNMHFPQNEVARAEALQIADTDHQYLSATAGKPLRGLIQDHISMGVQFTSRDVFLDRDAYQELIYSCLRPEERTAIFPRIQLVEPAILKPKALWTGKQVITTVLKNIVPQHFQGLNLLSRSSTSSDHWGENVEINPAEFDVTSEVSNFRDTEQTVIFDKGYHVSGILDKAQLGPSVGGVVHSVHELYGHIVAGKFLSILGRLLTRYLRERAWTCGMDDLYLTAEGDDNRLRVLKRSKRVGQEVAATYVSLKAEDLNEQDPQLLARLEGVLRHDDQMSVLDQMYNSRTKEITEKVTRACLPVGLRKPFPHNQMQAMTISGAKGSNVNANLISCNLGQQVLEGRRVPTMVSGKTLPSFRAFETDPIAGGYISGRFLTGIKPQEYFFHAMSGREGLIDTAVKTSKSGYLQRCIIKGVEGFKTEYDSSVRDSSNGAMIQFLYGEDGLEVTKQRHLREFSFLIQNSVSLSKALSAENEVERVEAENLRERQKEILKSLKKGNPAEMLDPITDLHQPAGNVGSTSESFAIALRHYIKDNPDRRIRDKKQKISEGLSKRSFQALMDLKYMKSIVDPGEAVGVVAGQSIGEPSTQMTLNTFHLAGHSAKNVTLGIPRLREILMTASPIIMTPTMTIKPISEISPDDATRFAKSISKLSLAEVIDTLSVTERVGGADHENEKLFDIKFGLYSAAEYEEIYAITVADVRRTLQMKFLPKLEEMIKSEFKKKAKEASLAETTAAVPDVGMSVGRVEEQRPDGELTQHEGGEDDLDDDADPDDAKQVATRQRGEDNYDEPDDDEIVEAESSESDRGSGDEDDDPATEIQSKSPRTPTSPEHSSASDSETTELNDSGKKGISAVKSSFHLNHLDHVKKFYFKSSGSSCNITMSYDTSTPKLLLLPIIEKCARISLIHSIPGLAQCALFQEPVKDAVTGRNVMVLNSETNMEEELKESVITTEGVNLLAMRDYQDILNPHTLMTNSITAMLKYYGVEAARMTIIREIDGVFKGHGISVDNRHLNLLADAMTQTGEYKAFSRHGVVKDGGSVLAKMSFETVMSFLKEAVLAGEEDPLLGPSARIVMGRRGGFGTGAFDVVVPV